MRKAGTVPMGAAIGVIAGVLLLVTAGPVNAQPRSTLNRKVVPTRITNARRMVSGAVGTSTLNLPAGFSQYLFVGGSAAEASVTDATFGSQTYPSCANTMNEVPMGFSHPPTPEGSFATTGTVAVLAGVAFSGYSVRRAGHLGNLSEFCSATTKTSIRPSFGFTTTKPGEVVVVLVGSDQVSGFEPMALQDWSNGTCNDVAGHKPKTLEDVTARTGKNDVAEAAIYSVALPQASSCQFVVRATSHDPSGGAFTFWSNSYVLVPR
jgi:hypothetical protein